MPLNGGQETGVIAALSGLGVAVLGYLASRYGAFTTRKTSIEQRLWDRIKQNEDRIDALTKDIDARVAERITLEAGFRKELSDLQAQIEALKRKEWEIMDGNRKALQQAEDKIEELQDALKEKSQQAKVLAERIKWLELEIKKMHGNPPSFRGDSI